MGKNGFIIPWRVYFFVAGAIIIIISTFYTKYLTDSIAESEKKKVELFAETMELIVNDANDLNADVKYAQSVLEKVNEVPVILVDESGEIFLSSNFPPNADLEKELEKIKQSGYPPIEGHGYARFIYFKHTHLLSLLTYFPIVQLALILVFVLIGFISLSNARRAEQNKVWVGMAKETAHQLGTPISGIMAWIEYLKEMNQGNPEQLEILGELNNDVGKLELIADRFSKIGSRPKLYRTNIIPTLLSVKNYIERRASNRIEFDFPDSAESYQALINEPLFSWVIENLLRNALDAMDQGVGKISATAYEDSDFVYIDISDTGKGIPANKQKTIFDPGYTTKTRGWGLGLSLAKRIIVDYHSGKIFVKRSVINEGTTFTVELKK